ncbi:hypothetical protein QM012_009380 [Aureobasidium pullulans]|uniref:Uncharacterized protein n=1 Tax=Aureobasidium pullulans TaxID=5580 RepID=A0ABR0TH84_AURPU
MREHANSERRINLEGHIDFEQHTATEEHTNPEAYIHKEEHTDSKEVSGAELEKYDDKNPVQTHERTYMYNYGVTSQPIPYFRGSTLNILEALNIEQEILANKRAISTIWRCTAGGMYYTLDIEDDRYPIIYQG